MERELLICRHAKSSWKDLSLGDYERPLKGRGRRDAIKMGMYLKENGHLPNYTLSSPARRAAQTVKRLYAAMELETNEIHWEPELYLAEPETWLRYLRKIPESTARALIVGHNPGLEELIIELCNHEIAIPEDGKLVPTATLVRLRLTTSWQELEPAGCTLIAIQRPRHLPD